MYVYCAQIVENVAREMERETGIGGGGEREDTVRVQRDRVYTNVSYVYVARARA